MNSGTCQSCGRPASSSLFRCVSCAMAGTVPAPRIRIRVELGNVRTINLASPTAEPVSAGAPSFLPPLPQNEPPRALRSVPQQVPQQRVSVKVDDPQPNGDEVTQVVTIESESLEQDTADDPPLAGARPMHYSDDDPGDGASSYTVTIERHDEAVEESAAMVDIVDRRIAAREEAARLAAAERAARQSAAVLALVNRRLAAREEAARLAAAETARRLAALYTPRQRPVPMAQAMAQAVTPQAAPRPRPAPAYAPPGPDPQAAFSAQQRAEPEYPDARLEHAFEPEDAPGHNGRIIFVFLLALALAVGGSIAAWILLGDAIQSFFGTVITAG
ncbi:MAG: hypothetical protein JWO79_2111 [Actinomycetia bacterium]|nr:hypothetical protein [Actinomycetes bacterium]